MASLYGERKGPFQKLPPPFSFNIPEIYLKRNAASCFPSLKRATPHLHTDTSTVKEARQQRAILYESKRKPTKAI
ncbi:hypothetical protein OUZ56_025138 [Daphnia magna]|uniref:Uncharacterized protein n=1 Tax=Daphnia magna TaxID=35525 RepID=A0ABQ9ZIZ2_9CRUS|nr:hypothetical protein OUZ56_025138 [Daphnia magna]